MSSWAPPDYFVVSAGNRVAPVLPPWPPPSLSVPSLSVAAVVRPTRLHHYLVRLR
jgi:hypothetical protein